MVIFRNVPLDNETAEVIAQVAIEMGISDTLLIRDIIQFWASCVRSNAYLDSDSMPGF